MGDKMKKTILIEKNKILTRLAFLQEGELISTYIDSPFEPDLQNKIIVGQVEQIIKNLNAAFVDYGEEKKGLLHLTQIPEYYKEKLKQGLRLPIQITGLNKGAKGNKLTAKVSIQGRYAVCLPFEPGISLSKKIKNPILRGTLREKVQALCDRSYGFIIRTEAMSCSEEDFEQEVKFLIQKVDTFMQSKDYLSKGSTLYEELPIPIEWVLSKLTLKDEITIVCDDIAYLEVLKKECADYGYGEDNIQFKHYTEKENLFFVYSIQKEWDKLFERKIWLKNGGNIVIEPTEAMTVIDVNSAKAVVSKNSRKAILELNKQAIREGLLQVLRRNLSGIIIMDLVEMPSNEECEEVYSYAKKILESYGEKKTIVYPLTELGLLQCARSKKYLSIGQKLLEPCPVCGNREGKDNALYQGFKLEQKIKEVSRQTTQHQMYVRCGEKIYTFLKENDLFAQLEETYSMTVSFEKVKHLQENSFLCQFYPF